MLLSFIIFAGIDVDMKAVGGYSMNRTSIILCLLVVLMAFAGCHKEDIHKGRTPIAAVGDVYLYKDDVELLYAVYGQGGDSVRFFREYIERWAAERLFYEKAVENVVATNDIESMVENYRHGLILSLYQDRLVSQQLVPDVSQADIQEFYENNEAMFEMEEPMLKGLVLKLSDKSPNINKVRAWCIRKSSDDFELIEKYSIAHSAYYNNFQEEWRTMADVASKIPLTEFQLNERLKKNSTIEFKHDGYTYFVSADTMIQKGETKPLEMVSAEIAELLVNSRKANFIKVKKQTLYKDALQTGGVRMF